MFWDRLGETWDSVKKTGAPLGTAFSGALDTKAGKAFMAFNALTNPAATAVMFGPQRYSEGLKVGGDVMSTPVNTVARGLSTQGLMTNAEGVSFFDPNAWKQAWKLTGKHTVAGPDGTLKEVEGISYGQQLAAEAADLLGGPDRMANLKDLQDDADAAQERERFFHDTWGGQLSSGTIDAAVQIFGDPLVMVGKYAKAAETASITLKTGEAGKVMDVVSGAEAGSRRVEKMAGKVDDFLGWTQGRSAAEIASHPVVASSPEKGTLAYLLSQAADREEAAALIGASLGDAKSVVKIQEKNAYLANDLLRLTEPPPEALALEKFTWDDFGQGMLDFANREAPREVELMRDQIVKEMARLDRVIEAAGTTNRVDRPWIGGGTDDGLRVTELRTGLAGRGITVAKGLAGNRLAGHVHLADPVKGYDQLNETLKQAPYITGAMRNELMSEFAAAATRGDRQGVVRKAEAWIVSSTAEHYGLTPEQAKQVMMVGQGRRAAYANLLQSRLYSAAPDAKFLHVVDPESGQIIARDLPSVQSQIEDMHAIVDPREFDAFVRAGSKNRLFDKMARYGFGVAKGDQAMGQLAADKLYATLDPLGELYSSMLMWGTRIWKDAMLLPRAAAYMTRTQIDSQFRMAAHMGAVAYMAEVPDLLKLTGKTVPKALKRVPKAAMPTGIGFEDEDFVKAASSYLVKAGIDEADVPQVVRNIRATGGSHADLVSEVANYQIQKARSSGSWGIVQPGDPNHQQAYLRVVNQQLRNSPTAMRAAEGATLEDLRQFIRTNTDGQAEWAELSGSWGHDLDHWLARVQSDVNYYLPTAELRSGAIERKLSDADYTTAFGPKSTVEAMPVHGESYTATARRPIADWYENARTKLYSLVSDAPETTMARVPLYVYEYQRALRRIAATDGSEVLGERALTIARKQADRIARRNVAKVLFDSSDTSNLAHTMRFVSPFFGAWEDMMKKWGRLFYENPAMVERFRQGWDAPNSAGMVEDEFGNRVDAEGNRIDSNTGLIVTDEALKGTRELLVIPMPKAMAKKMGIGEFRIDKRSFNIIFQGDPWWLPGSGPLVAVPANEIVKRAFPEAADSVVMQYLLPLGTSDKSVGDQLLPSWARHVHNAFGETADWKMVASTIYKTEYIKYQNGERDKPTLDEVSGRARNWFLLRAGLGTIAPVSVVPNPELQFYIDQAHIYQQKFGEVQDSDEYKQALADYRARYGDNAKAHLLQDRPEFTDWQARFYTDFPEFYDLAISTSESETGLNMNLASVSAFKKYRKEIAASPEWAWAIAGPDTAYGLDDNSKFSGAARDFMMSTETGPGSGKTLRSSLGPVEALEKAEESKGWRDYQAGRTWLNLELEKRGLTSVNQSGAEDLKGVWQQFRDELAAENPYWFRAYGQRDDAKVSAFLTDMRDAIAGNKTLAERGDMVALSDYIDGRGWMQEQMRLRGVRSLDAEAASDLAAMWDQFTSALVAESPGFEQIWSRQLDSDKLTTPLGR